MSIPARTLSFVSDGPSDCVVSPTGYLSIGSYKQGPDTSEYIRVDDEVTFMVMQDGPYKLVVSLDVKGPNSTTVALSAEVTECGCNADSASVTPLSTPPKCPFGYGASSTTNYTFEAPLKAKSTLRIRVVVSSGNSGMTNIHAQGTLSFVQASALLAELTAFDLATPIEYIPLRPPSLPNPPFPPQYPTPATQYPWGSPVIPNAPLAAGTNPTTLGLPNMNGYSKFPSIPVSVGFAFKMDWLHTKPNDPRLSIFVSNVADRGPNNQRKKVYMDALGPDKMPFYKEKMQALANQFYTGITNYKKPVLSFFKKLIIDFFLEVHLGYDIYPDYVIDYFTTFVDIIGYGDPTRPGRNEAFEKEYENYDRVYAYFEKRLQIIMATEDKTCIMYWWLLSGLKEQNPMEGAHNIIAFSQFVNSLYLMIVAFLLGLNTNPTPGAAPVKYNFLSLFKNATSDQEKLKVIFEMFRLCVPNTTSFSGVIPPAGTSPTPPYVQARLLHQLVMMTNDPTYPLFNTGRYANFTTTPDTVNPTVPGTAPHIPEDNFIVSSVDGQTVLYKNNPNVFPVFSRPTYASFGLGERRCAGEDFVYQLFMILMYRIMDLTFTFGPTDPVEPTVTTGPFTQRVNNIYVA
jgi:hypothetical protein